MSDVKSDNVPKSEDLWNEYCDYVNKPLYKIISDKICDKWRNGTEHEIIFNRLKDNTYWRIYYRSDNDGDYNSFRQNEEAVVQVKEVTKSITTYEGI